MHTHINTITQTSNTHCDQATHSPFHPQSAFQEIPCRVSGADSGGSCGGGAKRDKKTYNTRDSLVVTGQSTSLALTKVVCWMSGFRKLTV